MADIATVGFGYDPSGLTSFNKDLNAIPPAAAKAEAATGKFSKTVTAMGNGLSSGIGSVLHELKSGLIGIGVGLVASLGVNELMHSFSELAEKIDDVSKASTKLHDSMENVQGLALAADLAGQDFGALATSAQRMNKVLATAIATGKGTQGVFKILGTSAKELAAMPLTERFATLADTIQALNPTADQLALILAKLGDRSGSLAALFQNGGDDIREAQSLLKSFGGELNNLQGQNVERMNDAFTKLQYSIQAIGNQLVAWAAPTVATTIEGIASAIGDITHGIGNLITSTSPLVAGFRTAFGFIMSMFNPIGTGLKTLNELFTAVFGMGLWDTLKAGVNFIINAWRGGMDAIGIIWQHFPDIIGSAAIIAVNLAIKQINKLITGSINALNTLASMASNLFGGDAVTLLDPNKSKIPEIANPLKSEADAALNNAEWAIKARMGVDNFAASNDKASDSVKKNTKSIVDLNDALGGSAGTKAKADGAAQSLSALAAISDRLDQAGKPFEDASNAFSKLEDLQKNGIISGDQYTAMLGRIHDAFIAVGGTADQWAKIIATSTNSMSGAIKDFATNSLDSLGSSLADLVVDGKADFKSLADSIIKDLIRMAFQAAVVKPVLSFFGFGSGGSFGGGVAAFANGGAFTNGIYSRPTPFKFANGGGFSLGVMGEKGSEAVMPLKRGSDGSLGVVAHGANGGGTMQTVAIGKVEVNVQSDGNTSPEDDRRKGEQIANAVTERIKAVAVQTFQEMTIYGGAANQRGIR